MKIGERLSKDSGNALLEGVGFASIAFGLVLTSSLNLFDLQLQSLELSTIARNALREYQLEGVKTLEQLVLEHQRGTSLEDYQLQIAKSCQASCSSGEWLVLEIGFGQIKARAFGILSD